MEYPAAEFEAVNYHELLQWCDNVSGDWRRNRREHFYGFVRLMHSRVEPQVYLSERLINNVLNALEGVYPFPEVQLRSYVAQMRASAELQAPPNPPATPELTHYYSRRKREK